MRRNGSHAHPTDAPVHESSVDETPADESAAVDDGRENGVLTGDLAVTSETPPAAEAAPAPVSEVAVPADAAPSPAQIIEAVLFSSDSPVAAAKLADLVGDITPGEVKQLVGTLNAAYEAAGLTFRIEAIARGFQMLTLPQFRPWLSRLHAQRGDSRLSDAALETLAIIAYKQPVIRADIEAIRGVACGDGVNRLREMGLVKIVGRAEVVGRPLLYGTTKRFLDIFGLGDLKDLPPLEELGLGPRAGQNGAVKPAAEPPVTKPLAEVEPVTPDGQERTEA